MSRGLTAASLMEPNTHNIRVAQFFTTSDGMYNTKQLIMRSNDTTLKKKLGGPQAYVVKIRAIDPEITTISGDTKVQVYCNCHDFIYRRAYCLSRDDALLISEGFVLTPAEKTNPTCNKKACKHVSAALQYLITTGR